MAHMPSKMYSVERRAHRAGTPIVAPMPAPPANGEIMAELRALRAAMAELRETVANGLQPVTAPLDDADAMKRDVRVEIAQRSEEHTSELQSLMRLPYAVFCFKKR